MRTVIPILILLLISAFAFSEEFSFILRSGAKFIIKTPEGKTLDDCFENPELIPEYYLDIYTLEQHLHYSAGSPIVTALSEFFQECHHACYEEPIKRFFATGFSLSAISRCSLSIDHCILPPLQTNLATDLRKLDMEELSHSTVDHSGATPLTSGIPDTQVQYICLFEHCQMIFGSCAKRSKHHRSYHKDSYEKLQKEKNVKCKLCKKSFGNLQGLLQHHSSGHFGLKLFD